MLSTFPLPGEGFYCSAFSSCLTDLANYRTPPRLIYAPNHAPVAADSAAGREGVRSTTKGEIFKWTDGACADPDTRIFPATGAHPPALPSNSNPTSFHVTHRFFGTFLTQESTVTPRPLLPSPPSFFPPISKKICVSGWKRRPFAL